MNYHDISKLSEFDPSIICMKQAAWFAHIPWAQGHLASDLTEIQILLQLSIEAFSYWTLRTYNAWPSRWPCIAMHGNVYDLLPSHSLLPRIAVSGWELQLASWIPSNPGSRPHQGVVCRGVHESKSRPECQHVPTLKPLGVASDVLSCSWLCGGFQLSISRFSTFLPHHLRRRLQ